jgi:hypothetical protein
MPERPPNVIVVFTDQQRWDTTGVHGNPLGLAPNFDSMARTGSADSCRVLPFVALRRAFGCPCMVFCRISRQRCPARGMKRVSRGRRRRRVRWRGAAPHG